MRKSTSARLVKCTYGFHSVSQKVDIIHLHHIAIDASCLLRVLGFGFCWKSKDQELLTSSHEP